MVATALHDVLNVGLRHCVLDVFGVSQETLQARDYQPPPEGYQARWIDFDEISALADTCDDPTLPTFLAEEYEDAWECFAVLDDQGNLANYFWYTNEPVPFLESLDLLVEFPDRYCYGFKAYTRVSERGKRLQPYALGAAMTSGRMGRDNLMVLISAFNYPSLGWARYQGFEKLGRFLVIRWGKRCSVFPSRSLKQAQIRMIPDHRSSA